MKPKKSNRTTPTNPEMRGASRKSEVARSREKDSQERLDARIAELEVELQRKDQVARDARAELAEALEQQAATADRPERGAR